MMNITNTLATFFIDENLKARGSQAIGTSDFLETELASMRHKLEQKEKALEAFRTSNMGELPEQLETNLRSLDRLQEQLTSQQESLRDARSRLAASKSGFGRTADGSRGGRGRTAGAGSFGPGRPSG